MQTLQLSGHFVHDLTQNELAFSSTTNLQFYHFQILKFVFQLIYKQRIEMNDMLVTYYGKAMLNIE